MSSEPPSEQDVAAFLEGDPALVSRIRSAIAGVVRAFRFPDADLREELVQDSLARVFVNLRGGRFRGDSSLKTYAQNVAKYTCLEQIRRRRGEETLDAADAERSPDGSPGPEESLLKAERHRRNLQAFARLPKECRELFRLIFVEGLSYREVASCLGVSEGAVKLRVYRCRLIGLRALPGEEGAGPAPRKPAQVGRNYQGGGSDPDEG